jgi:hypothetical protein
MGKDSAQRGGSPASPLAWDPAQGVATRPTARSPCRTHC